VTQAVALGNSGCDESEAKADARAQVTELEQMGNTSTSGRKAANLLFLDRAGQRIPVTYVCSKGFCKCLRQSTLRDDRLADEPSLVRLRLTYESTAARYR